MSLRLFLLAIIALKVLRAFHLCVVNAQRKRFSEETIAYHVGRRFSQKRGSRIALPILLDFKGRFLWPLRRRRKITFPRRLSFRSSIFDPLSSILDTRYSILDTRSSILNPQSSISIQVWGTVYEASHQVCAISD